jgi:hypothetical protein
MVKLENFDTVKPLKGHWQRIFLLLHLKEHEKNKPVGRLMLYSISSSSEVISKNEQNINCCETHRKILLILLSRQHSRSQAPYTDFE